jgi:hypothetical protein
VSGRRALTVLLKIETMRDQVRTRTGEYSPQAASSAIVSGGGKEAGKGDTDSKGDKKDAKKGGGGGGCIYIISVYMHV